MASVVKRGGVMQRLLLWLVALLFRPRPGPGDGPPRCIALLRFDARVGEVLLQTPLIAELRRAFPAAELVAVTHPNLAHLLKGQPDVDQVMPFQLRGFPFSASSWQSLRRLARLRADVAIDCSNYTLLSTSHALATLASRAHRRIGFARGGEAAEIAYSEPVVPLAGEASERRQRLHLLSALGVTVEDARTRYLPGEPRSAEVAALLADLAAGPGRFAMINPGGRLGWRRVEPTTLAAAARQLIERGRQPVVVWGPGERKLAVELCMAVGPRARLAPPTSIDELAALFASAGCTISNNSGPMHLSIATAAPTLAVFLDMPVARWGEQRSPHAVVDLSDCDDPAARLVTAVDRFLDSLDAE